MSEIVFTKKEKLRLKELANMDFIFPKALVKGGLLDWCVVVCKYYQISLQEFNSSCRERHLIKARRDFCHLIKKNTDISQARIARFMDRHHTNVMHHLQKNPFNIDKINAP